MKIAAWNVNSIRPRLEQVLDWMQVATPDVLLVQELKCLEEAFPRGIFEDAGYTCAVYGQKTYNGVAIIAKGTLEDVTPGLPTFTDDPNARYIEAVVDGWLRVASVYVPNGEEPGSEKYAYKQVFYEKLKTHLHTCHTLEQPMVVGGDFNVAAQHMDMGKPYDPKHPRILTSLPEREWLNSLLHDGWYDSFRLLNPEQTDYSWWDYRAGSFEQNKGFRIDYLLANPWAADRLCDASIDPAPRGNPKPSDHTPVVCTLRV